MSRLMALPFVLKRSDDIIGEEGITSTAETIHGVLRLDGESLVFVAELELAVAELALREVEEPSRRLR